MTDLTPRVDGRGNTYPASAMDVDRATATASRIRGEVAEIRGAADDLAAGTDFEVAVSAFLTVQAELLERNGGTPQRADNLSPLDDSRENAAYFTTPARSALLIARAYNDRKD